MWCSFVRILEESSKVAQIPQRLWSEGRSAELAKEAPVSFHIMGHLLAYDFFWETFCILVIKADASPHNGTPLLMSMKNSSRKNQCIPVSLYIDLSVSVTFVCASIYFNKYKHKSSRAGFIWSRPIYFQYKHSIIRRYWISCVILYIYESLLFLTLGITLYLHETRFVRFPGILLINITGYNWKRGFMKPKALLSNCFLCFSLPTL